MEHKERKVKKKAEETVQMPSVAFPKRLELEESFNAHTV